MKIHRIFFFNLSTFSSRQRKLFCEDSIQFFLIVFFCCILSILFLASKLKAYDLIGY